MNPPKKFLNKSSLFLMSFNVFTLKNLDLKQFELLIEIDIIDKLAQVLTLYRIYISKKQTIYLTV